MLLALKVKNPKIKSQGLAAALDVFIASRLWAAAWGYWLDGPQWLCFAATVATEYGVALHGTILRLGMGRLALLTT